MTATTGIFIHPKALVESEQIGEGTRIWAFAHVMRGAVVGRDCNLGDQVFVEEGARIGNGVTVKNSVLIWKGVHIADYAFIGPNAIFTNDRYPRSPRMPEVKQRYASEKTWLAETFVEEGVTIGANATILCGIRLGTCCCIAAGSVVTKNVEPFRIVAGNPARPVGFVDRSGQVLRREGETLVNPQTGKQYRIDQNLLVEIK